MLFGMQIVCYPCRVVSFLFVQCAAHSFRCYVSLGCRTRRHKQWVKKKKNSTNLQLTFYEDLSVNIQRNRATVVADVTERKNRLPSLLPLNDCAVHSHRWRLLCPVFFYLSTGRLPFIIYVLHSIKVCLGLGALYCTPNVYFGFQAFYSKGARRTRYM